MLRVDGVNHQFIEKYSAKIELIADNFIDDFLLANISIYIRGFLYYLSYEF